MKEHKSSATRMPYARGHERPGRGGTQSHCTEHLGRSCLAQGHSPEEVSGQ